MPAEYSKIRRDTSEQSAAPAPPGAAAEPQFLELGNGLRLAYHALEGRAPTVVFLGGFTSNMDGTKALFVEQFCRARGQGFVRFDYRGHGASSGRFVDGTIGAWRDDALAVMEARTRGPLLLVGSSMGAWIMLLSALLIPERVHALIGIAAAPDFTEELVWQRLPEPSRAELLREGQLEVPSQYVDEGYPIALDLIEEGRRHLLLDRDIGLHCPVRLLHGTDDVDVPWQLSARLLERLASVDATLTLVKSGDHRLSRREDLQRLAGVLGAELEPGRRQPPR